MRASLGTTRFERGAEPGRLNRPQLRRWLWEFNTGTRNRVATLTGPEEFARPADLHGVLREFLETWPNLERLLCRHGAFYPLINKV